jgi:hypothetical protein
MAIAPETFVKALEQHPDAMKSLSWDTRRRYLTGRLPRVVIWLLANPAVLRTLCELANTEHNKAAASTAR